jgi:quercetin dioxygenase-like cupin family protein
MADFVIQEWELSGYDGDQAPRHVHHGGEEAFVCLEGDLEVEIDGERRRVQPGSYAVIHRDATHTFASREGARVLAIMTEEIARLVGGLHEAPTDEARAVLWAECNSALV